jgi:hypothetical protein
MISLLVLLGLCDAYIDHLILLLACGGGGDIDGTDQGCLLIEEPTLLLLEALVGVLSRDDLLRL